MQTPRNVLTPDALAMLQVVAQAGSFAAAARRLGLVPSALTYRVRQIEETLDVLLFDRSARQARLTAAGETLLSEGQRLLNDMDAIANRVKRVATGWESEFTIAVDGILEEQTVMELCEAFLQLNAPTRLRIRSETLAGTLEALTQGKADLALGVAGNPAMSGAISGIQIQPLGTIELVFAIAPQHPLASLPEPLSEHQIRQYRAIAVADTAQQDPMTVGLLPGQDVFTLSDMRSKIQAQVRGLGVGFLPLGKIAHLLARHQLLIRQVDRPARVAHMGYAWRTPDDRKNSGRALQWWLQQLKSPTTRAALLVNPRRPSSTRNV